MYNSSYASQSIYSEPGLHREALAQRSNKPESLARWIASLVQHPRGAESKALGFGSQQVADLQLRSVSELLDTAKERNLLEGAILQPKVGGVCRDFAILAASGFRERDIPARLRVGFADYLVPDRWEDHWLCEWHDGRRWKRLDVELASIDEGDFDASDVPAERFLTAGEAWRKVKSDPATAQHFGVSSLDLCGEWFVAGSLLREMAALRKLELKPWDYWGFSASLSHASSDWPSHARRTFDILAAQLTDADVDGIVVPESLADWALPDRVVSFPSGEPIVVNLRESSVPTPSYPESS